MSAKSLLQLILLLLIFLIIAGIYYLYFYSGPLKNHLIIDNEKDKTNTKIIEEANNNDQEILEDVVILKEKNIIKTETRKENKKDLLDNQTVNNKLNPKDEIKKNETTNTKTENIKNLTKEIEYITSNKNGDVFNILAKYGKTNIENSKVLDLEEVDGVISSASRSKIYITSDHAKYNYDDQNSKFYSNVIIRYDNKIITCDNLDLKINENYAIAYNNVVIKDNKSVMKAQIVTLNLITKDININSQDKIKILTN